MKVSINLKILFLSCFFIFGNHLFAMEDQGEPVSSRLHVPESRVKQDMEQMGQSGSQEDMFARILQGQQTLLKKVNKLEKEKWINKKRLNDAFAKIRGLEEYIKDEERRDPIFLDRLIILTRFREMDPEGPHD